MEKATNPHGMELYRQNIGGTWVDAPFPLVLEVGEVERYGDPWMAADQSATE